MAPSIGIVAAVNDETVLNENLKRSPLIENGAISLLELRQQPSASRAYNVGLDATSHEIIVFAHQDVYLPAPWLDNLLAAIATLERQQPHWGVIGLFGVTATGEAVGHVWSSGIGRELGAAFAEPIEVVSIDEMVIVLRRASGLRFDERLAGFHLYATDICLTARMAGAGVYVVHAPAVHNSVPVRTLRGYYLNAYRYLKKKWAFMLPIRTPIAPITRYELGFWRAEWRRLRTRITNSGRPSERRDARLVARTLGYEQTIL
jgi:glycosyltransferase involved in cell wall biosynthesis